MTTSARRSRTDYEAATAGSLSGDDIGRPVEIDYAWTGASEPQRIGGLLSRLRADSLGVVLQISGDPNWPFVEPIVVMADHPVRVAPHPEASRR